MKYEHNIDFAKSSVLVSVLKHDGSVQITVGGIDMGQGQHMRCAQIAARNLGCDLDKVRVKPTNTEVAPNSSPTGGTITTHTMMLLINNSTDNLKKRMVEACSTDDKSAENLSWDELWTKCKSLPDFDYQERAAMKFSGPGAKDRIAK